MSVRRRPRSVHAKTVPLAGPDALHVPVPAERRSIRQTHAMLFAAVVEEAQVDAVGHLREHREARPFSVPMRAQRKRFARPCFKFHVFHLRGAPPPRLTRFAAYTARAYPQQDVTDASPAAQTCHV